MTQIKYLLLPAIALCLVLFGYIARMARAGMIEALDSDYTRTATLKGLPRRTVIRRHVLRNALLPTITVIATQLGYLIGGLVVVEIIFNYQGIGRLILTAPRPARTSPMLEAGVLVVGVVYLVGDADRRRALRAAQSADPLRRERPVSAVASSVGPADAVAPAVQPNARATARRETLRALLRSKTLHRRRDHRRLLGALRDLRPALGAQDPLRRPAWTCSSRRPASTGSAPTGSAATSSRASSSAPATS